LIASLEHDFRAKYVRNYLLQREKLLSEAHRAITSKKKLPPKLLSQFGVRIFLPRQDTGGKLVEEVWRVAIMRGESKDNEAAVGRELLDPSCGVGLPCKWLFSKGEHTIGIPKVKRIVLDLPLIREWLELRTRNDAPESEMEKCVQLCNTVDLDVGHSWPLKEDIPRPAQQWVESFTRKSPASFFSKYSSEGGHKELVQVGWVGDPTQTLVVYVPKEVTTTKEETNPDLNLSRMSLEEENADTQKIGSQLVTKTFSFLGSRRKPSLSAGEVCFHLNLTSEYKFRLD